MTSTSSSGIKGGGQGRARATETVVLGAGFGGLAAAIRALARGENVTLIDQCEAPGGRGQVLEHDGFRHDTGPTVWTAPFLVDELFQLLGEKREDRIDLLPVEPWYRYVFDDGRTFDYGGTVEDTCRAIAEFREGDVDGYRRLVKTSQRLYQTGFEELGDQPFDGLGSMVKVLPSLARLGAWRSVWQLVCRHLKDPALRQAFSIQPLLVGGNPFDTTCIYSLIHYLERAHGVWFPRGGTGAMASELAGLFERHGGRLRLSTAVQEIVTDEGSPTVRPTARGVRLADGSWVRADRVIANIDPPHVYSRMLPGVRRKRWTDRRLNRLRFSMGLFVVFFGTKRRYDEVPHHTIVLGPRYRELLRDIFHRGVLADDMSIYLHRPTATDPSFAPAGCDSFYALAPVPNLRAGIDWSVEGPRYQRAILQRLEETVLPGLQDSIVQPSYRDPVDFESRFCATEGAGFSIQPLLTQSAGFRFNNKSEEVEGLFFVGAGTHPGAGLPGVLSSAKVVDRLVSREQEAS